MSLRAVLNQTLKPALLACVIGVLPGLASASTFTLSLPDNYFGTNGSAGATIHDSSIPLNEGVLAGGFAATGDLHGTGPENFTAWCLDIVTWMQLSSSYVTTGTPFQTAMTATRISNITRLFDTGYSALKLTDSTDSGGFQLALWEVMNENSATFDLSAGNFTATSDALAKGQALLAGMSGPVTQSYRLTWLQSDDSRIAGGHYSQNLVTVSTVPLPAAGLLLVGALGGLAALRRRQTKA